MSVQLNYRPILLFAAVSALLALGFLYARGTQENTYGLRSLGANENAESYLRGQIWQCLRSGEAGWRGTCFRELGELLSSQFELDDALKILAVLDDEEGIKQQCHALVHYLGQNEFAKSGSLPQTFTQCRASPTACGEGCFHGAVEGYISKDGGTLLPEDVARACSRDFAPNEVTYRACTHGLGHAFMLVNSGDILPSLASCSSLKEPKDRESCYDGVFMENVFGFGSADHPSKFIRPEEPTYPCTEVDEAYRNSCYGSQSVFAIERGGQAFEEGAAFCASVPAQYQKTCFGSLGGSAVVHFSDPLSVRNICDLAPQGPFRQQCLYEALFALSYQYAGDPEPMGDLCFVAREEDKASCVRSAGSVIESWFPGERAALCERISARGTSEYKLCAS